MLTSVSIRDAQPSDLPFIYSSWLKSYKHDSKLGRSIRSSIFFENYREVLDKLLLNSSIKIISAPNDSNVILGYLVYSYDLNKDLIIHYCFVKQPFRRLGLANTLINSVNLGFRVICTHITNEIQSHALNELSYEYNPILLYKRESHE